MSVARRAGWLLAACALAAATLAGVVGATTIGGGTGPSCNPPPPGNSMLQVAAGRPAVFVHMPRQPRRNLPLLLALPGYASTGRDLADETGYDALANRVDLIVAYPTASGTRPEWNISGSPKRADDVAYLRQVIEQVAAATCANRDRVLATGVSNGAGMTARLACDAADLLAAVAPVAGGYSRQGDCNPARRLPLLEIHGTSDDIVPYGGKDPDGAGSVPVYLYQWRRIDGCHGPAKRESPRPGVDEIGWRTCADHTVVEHVRLEGVGHGWPGGSMLDARSAPFSATRRTWSFLRRFRRPPAAVGAVARYARRPTGRVLKR